MRLIVGLLLTGLVSAAVGAPDGGQLYMTHCAACHGDKGDGGVGVPLALPTFLESVDDVFMHRTIRLGRPGRVMPAFTKLSDAQIDAIISHIRGWSEKPAPKFSDTPVKGDPKKGKTLYASYCASCHGVNGEGGKGTGVTFSRKRNLPIIAPALNNPGFLAAASDAMIRHTLQFGREGTPMRSFLEQGLAEKDIDDLVSYVRSFSKQAEATATATETTEKVIIVESPYTLEETIENLKQSIVGQNFLLIRTEFLEYGLVEEGKEDKHQVIMHFCNFKFLFDALAIDPRIGIFLPCRVTVVEHEGKVLVMAVNPKYLSALFNNDELNEACKQMYEIYSTIIEDAVL
ncbi:MAG: c-type cytochrome [Gammaproteobacteria bacterium]|nr:c-type cytochrome [Gammaproteobacteria bacterium]